MSVRARPGDRQRIEAALSPADLRSLIDACRLFSVPRDRWQRVPSLERHYTTLATARLAERIRLDEGAAYETSLDEAAARLRVPSGTVHTRLSRWLKYAHS